MIEIGSTRLITGATYTGLADIGSRDDLFQIFITDVFPQSKPYQFTVDSFPFLYAVVARVYYLSRTTGFLLDIGEGLETRPQ